MDRLEGVTRTKLQAGIDEGLVLVNDQVVKSNLKVKPGDIITVYKRRPRFEEGGLPAEDIGGLDVRYEDAEVLVVFKPAGLVVHPGVGNHSGTLANGLLYHLKSNDEEPPSELNGQDRPGIVHRIDKHTTGLLVIAKTEHAMQFLSKQFFDHDIERTYKALVWGNLDNDEGTIHTNIGRHPRYPKLRAVVEDGKEAITHYKVLKRYGYTTLVECKLETGRTHQIRVHFQHIGHPLFGDFEYGGNKIVKGTVFNKYKKFVENCFDLMPAQALHAFSLGFVHPTSHEKIYLEADLPDNFKALLQKWEDYTRNRL
jgi:23S rRNA pseudouridine1911/1915/1917 synthase